jgi:hypothetical protein
MHPGLSSCRISWLYANSAQQLRLIKAIALLGLNATLSDFFLRRYPQSCFQLLLQHESQGSSEQLPPSEKEEGGM